MIRRIHIFGASGSGTSTLAESLCREIGWKHYDTDDYYWLTTSPPYLKSRNIEKRIELLDSDLRSESSWVLSGSLCGWGDVFIPQFDLVIYLWIPKEIRMERLKVREAERYGEEILEGGSMYENYNEFMKWASEYDTGDMSMRSRCLHNKWLEDIQCKVLRIEEVSTLEEKIKMIRDYIEAGGN